MSQAWLIWSRYVDQSSKFTDVYLQTIFLFSVTVTNSFVRRWTCAAKKGFFHLKLCLKIKQDLISSSQSPHRHVYCFECLLINEYIYISVFFVLSSCLLSVWEKERYGSIKLVSVHRFFDPTAFPIIWKGPTNACKTHKRFVNKTISLEQKQSRDP